VPSGWPGFSIAYRFGSSQYTIDVKVSRGGSKGPRITIDGRRIKGDAIPLVDDGQPHTVVVEVTRG
jgi:cellobiose phosphorylase